MSSPPDSESIPSPAVSSLRSRFEQLAVDTSITQLKRPISSYDFLAPDSHVPRPRAASGAYGPHSADPNSSNQLRPSSSSSDLKGTKRPPPPPPGPRGSSKPPSPSASPLLHPSHAHHSSPTSLSSMVTLNSAIKLSSSPTRKPPPPPPHSSHLLIDFESSVSHTVGDVAPVVSRVSSVWFK
jgi:hypothetical protein